MHASCLKKGMVQKINENPDMNEYSVMLDSKCPKCQLEMDKMVVITFNKPSKRDSDKVKRARTLFGQFMREKDMRLINAGHDVETTKMKIEVWFFPQKHHEEILYFMIQLKLIGVINEFEIQDITFDFVPNILNRNFTIGDLDHPITDEFYALLR
jgi:hypothetical protein